jgi:hypothetical protein
MRPALQDRRAPRRASARWKSATHCARNLRQSEKAECEPHQATQHTHGLRADAASDVCQLSAAPDTNSSAVGRTGARGDLGNRSASHGVAPAVPARRARRRPPRTALGGSPCSPSANVHLLDEPARHCTSGHGLQARVAVIKSHSALAPRTPSRKRSLIASSVAAARRHASRRPASPSAARQSASTVVPHGTSISPPKLRAELPVTPGTRPPRAPRAAATHRFTAASTSPCMTAATRASTSCARAPSACAWLGHRARPDSVRSPHECRL